MFQPCIKDKHSLIDLAKYGTLARKKVHPDLLIGNYPIGLNWFKEGDILDANAVHNLIIKSMECKKQSVEDFIAVKEDLSNKYYELISQFEELQESLRQECDDNSSSIDDINSQLDDVYTKTDVDSIAQRIKDDVYTKTDVDSIAQQIKDEALSEKTKHSFMTQGQYDELTTYDPNTIYFIWDGEAPEGDWTFPIELTGDASEFPMKLPITLS